MFFFGFCVRGDRAKGCVRGWVDVLALDALCELCGHARVHLHCRAMFCLVQYSHSQVSCPWTDFKDLIRRAEVGLGCTEQKAKALITYRRTEGNKKL
jgi:hypothetical protein